MHELSHLAGSFAHQLCCDFRCIALAMQRKSRIIDTQNSSAILQYFIHDTTLVGLNETLNKVYNIYQVNDIELVV